MMSLDIRTPRDRRKARFLVSMEIQKRGQKLMVLRPPCLPLVGPRWVRHLAGESGHRARKTTSISAPLLASPPPTIGTLPTGKVGIARKSSALHIVVGAWKDAACCQRAAAKLAIADHLGRPLAKLPEEDRGYIDGLLRDTLERRTVIACVRGYFRDRRRERQPEDGGRAH